VVLLVFVASEAVVLGAGANTTINLNSLLGKTVNMGPAVGDPPAVEIPNVQVFVYDDGQGNEFYVMFQDSAEHTREEIMSAQTVTADEINKVFAGFTSKFHFEIRAMSHDGFDKARLDKIASRLLPDDVGRSGVISFFAEPMIVLSIIICYTYRNA
jgi:hypothetical protein